jgi:spore maturation protein B
MKVISVWCIPIFVFIIVFYGFIKKVNVFDAFMEGTKSGFKSVASIAPALTGLFAAIGVFRSSGAMDIIAKCLSPVTDHLNIPTSLVNFALLRPISGSGSLALAKDIITSEGADSFAAFATSVMMGSTETTFYTLAIYFGSVGIRKTRYAPACSLMADCVSFVMSFLITKWIFAL